MTGVFLNILADEQLKIMDPSISSSEGEASMIKEELCGYPSIDMLWIAGNSLSGV